MNARRAARFVISTETVTDNRLENLAWGTKVQNRQDRIAHGNSNRGEKNNTTKLTEVEVREIRESDQEPKTLAAKYGVTKVTIGHVKRRKTWAHLN